MSNENEIEWQNLEDDAEASQVKDGGIEASKDGRGDDETRSLSATDLDAVFDIPVNVSAVLGKAHLEVSQLMKLGPGAIIELDRKVGEAIDIFVNNRLVARGEVVVIDERLGVTMTEIIKGDRG